PRPSARWTDNDHARIASIGAAVCDEFEARGVTGRPVFWHRDRACILRDLRRILLEDDECRRSRGTRPVAAELAFGLRDGVAAVAIALPDGRELQFRGKADRVDKGDDGSLHVVDYKTGSTRKFAGLSADDPDK